MSLRMVCDFCDTTHPDREPVAWFLVRQPQSELVPASKSIFGLDAEHHASKSWAFCSVTCLLNFGEFDAVGGEA